MPKENASPDAILDAIKKVDIVSELLEDKNKNNLKMIAEGITSWGDAVLGQAGDEMLLIAGSADIPSALSANRE